MIDYIHLTLYGRPWSTYVGTGSSNFGIPLSVRNVRP